MYAETGLMFPYFDNFSPELHPFDEFCCSQKPNASSGIQGSLTQTSTISDYNLGGEGDLFKAPEPVIAEPSLAIDPMVAAISMISCGEDAISPQSLTVSDIESSIESGQILSEVFYECRKDLLAKEGNETPLSEVFNIKIPNDNFTCTVDENLVGEGQFQKSISSSCLRSMDFAHEPVVQIPNYVDHSVLDFGDTAYGMRRAFSEGDIKNLSSGEVSFAQSSKAQPNITSTCASQVRREKLSRYWTKKSKRNFGRKIKYACRKALADSQPRIRGRFAKTEEICTSTSNN